jgi:hypothetical protein
VCLLETLGKAFDDIVLICLGEGLYLVDYAFNGCLIHQQAGFKLLLVFCFEATLYLRDLIPAIEELILLVDVRQCFLDDGVDREAGWTYHEQGETCMRRKGTFR